MQWQNGTSAAKSGYKFSYETVVDYASLPYVVAGYYYYVKDRLGNVRVVLNGNGDVEQKTNYIITIIKIQLVCHGKRGKN